MSEKKKKKKQYKLFEKGKKCLQQEQYYKAIDFLDQSLSFDPEFREALEAKGFALGKLGNLEECYQIYFKSNLIKLKDDSEFPSDINSIESWIKGAQKLIERGQNQRAWDFLTQASFLSPIVDKEGGFLAHHNNANIYYYSAIRKVYEGTDYVESKLLFNKAIKLDQNLKIPDDIEHKFEEFVANRNGKDVELIVPLDSSNLLTTVPSSDKILCSASAKAQSSYSRAGSDKTTFINWDTHLLLTLNGIALNVSGYVSNISTHFIPWVLIRWGKPRSGRSIWVRDIADDIWHSIILTIIPKKGVKKNIKYEFIDRFKPIMEQRIIEMEEKVEEKLRSLTTIPTYFKYIYDNVPKDLYKRVKKKIKKERKM